jgi:hypothetical protein
VSFDGVIAAVLFIVVVALVAEMVILVSRRVLEREGERYGVPAWLVGAGILLAGVVWLLVRLALLVAAH